MKRVLAPVVAAALFAVLPVVEAMSAPSCFGARATIVGDGSSELLRGTPKRDVIVAKEGNDIIRGRGGPDLICAGGGEDEILGGRGGDKIKGNNRTDILHGGKGNDLLNGGKRNSEDLAWDDLVSYRHSATGVTVDLDGASATGEGEDRIIFVEQVEGSEFDDVIDGWDSSENRLFGLGGNDQMTGGDYRNFFEGGPGDDTMDAGPPERFEDIDLVSFEDSAGPVTVDLTEGTATGEGSDTLIGFEDVEGSAFNDRITGNRKPNRLFGLAGDDELSGLDGDDSLDGDAGNDDLDGGAGTDRCVGGESTEACET